MDAAVGTRVLGEIEEASLDEVLATLRATVRKISNETVSITPVVINSTVIRPTNVAINAVSRDSSTLKPFPISALDALVTRHYRATRSETLVVSGRQLPLLYLLVATLIASPHSKAVVVIDLEGRFDVTRVRACVPFSQSPVPDSDAGREPDGGRPSISAEAGVGDVDMKSTTGEQDSRNAPGKRDSTMAAARSEVMQADLHHLYVYRPSRGSVADLRDLLTAAEQYMLYGAHGSRSREWWGTMVIGAAGAMQSAAGGPCKVDVAAGWRGWLRVDRIAVPGFGLSFSAEEALADRDRRQDAVDAAGWKASSVWGGFTFSEDGSNAGADTD